MMSFLTEERKIIHGIVIAKVIDNNDIQKLGRIKISFPALSGEKAEYWASYAVLMAGGGTGTLFLPEVGEQVVVAFENGEIARPFILGSIWSNAGKPPEAEMGDKNNIRIIKSRSGHIIRLDDTEGSEKIEIIDKQGKNLLQIDTANNTITIQSDQDILLKAPKGKVNIEAKEFLLSAEKAEISASDSLKLEGSSQTDIKGGKVNIN